MATGVYYQKDRDRWRARVRSGGKEFFVYRRTEEEAIKAYENLRAGIPTVRTKASHEEIKIKSRIKNAEWYRKNKHKANAKSKSRKARKKRAEPTWGRKITAKRYAELSEMSERLAGLHDIDHCVPITGKLYPGHDLQLVCGLHICYNLRLMPASKNRSKSCSAWPHKPNYTEEDINELRKLAKENC